MNKGVYYMKGYYRKKLLFWVIKTVKRLQVRSRESV